MRRTPISLMLVSACFTGAPAVDLDGAPCPCAEGWICCVETGRCVSDPGECADRLPVDAATVRGTPDAGDPDARSSTITLTCHDPTADCVDRFDELVDGICTRRDLTCNVLEEPCPDPYRCNDGRCVCHDIRRCGRCCEQDEDCDHGDVCDTVTASCHPPLACVADASCPAGEICASELCRPPGSRRAGAACTEPAQCESNVCVTDVCLARCTANSDCDEGLSCTGGDEISDALTCRRYTRCAGCDEPDQFCFGECYQEHCDTSAECGGRPCTSYSVYTDLRVCGPPPYPDPCSAPDGFVYETTSATLCLTYAMCWSDADCSAPHRCVTSEDFPYWPRLDDLALGLCGRAI
jgi:hypothetical protein